MSKLTYYTPENVNTPGHKRDRPAKISILKKGLFHISQAAVEKMELESGNKIAFVKMPGDDKTYYIKKQTGDAPGFQLKLLKDTMKILSFSNSHLRTILTDDFYDKPPIGKTISILIGGATDHEDGKLWPLLPKPII